MKHVPFSPLSISHIQISLYCYYLQLFSDSEYGVLKHEKIGWIIVILKI
jgi:hypothetical protein